MFIKLSKMNIRIISINLNGVTVVVTSDSDRTCEYNAIKDTYTGSYKVTTLPPQTIESNNVKIVIKDADGNCSVSYKVNGKFEQPTEENIVYLDVLPTGDIEYI